MSAPLVRLMVSARWLSTLRVVVNVAWSLDASTSVADVEPVMSGVTASPSARGLAVVTFRGTRRWAPGDMSPTVQCQPGSQATPGTLMTYVAPGAGGARWKVTAVAGCVPALV